MAKRKKIEVEPEEKQEEDIFAGFVTLTAEEKYQLLLLDAYIKNYELSLRLNVIDFNNLKRQHEAEVQNLMLNKNIKKNELSNLKETIETKYGIKFSECTFDENSGRITRLPE